MSPPKNKRKKPFRVRMTRIWGIIIISIKDLGVGSQIPLGLFWVLQSKGAVSGPPLSHHPWNTAWVGCPVLASLRPLPVTCCEDTLVILVFPCCAVAFLTQYGAVCYLVHSVATEWSGLNLCDLTKLLCS